MPLPRHVITKRLANGVIGFYYNVPTKYKKLKCPVSSEPLGSDFVKMQARAALLNSHFDDWERDRKGLPVTGATIMPRYGTVDWLFREYILTDAYTEKVALRSRGDYEWSIAQICDLKTNSGTRIGDQLVRSVTPRAADKLYNKFIIASGGKLPPGKLRLRTGEKLVGLCRKAWRVVHRLYPNEFDVAVPNPWTGVTTKVRQGAFAKAEKPAVDREAVYAFAWGAIDAGYPEVGATAVICFEWLQRPENVVAGFLTWSDYRAPSAPSIIRVEHHKTNTVAPHPLEEFTSEGMVKFYADAEEVLSRVPRLGVPMILRNTNVGGKVWRYSSLNHVVARLRKTIEGVPPHFTLDACRHGGMTELEEAELTDGQGRALSTHRTQQSYQGYAKKSAPRMLSATRKRHAHRLANERATSIQNDTSDVVQNENSKVEKSA